MKAGAVALIDEARCIGCRRCIDACPVDAIVGAQGLMHTVVEPWCIGCERCLPPCPVDCIGMLPRAEAWTAPLRRAAGERGRRRRQRLRRQEVRTTVVDRGALLREILARKRRP